MIIPSPSEIQAKLDIPRATTPSPRTPPPPPVHPALQYGISASAASPPGYESTRRPLTTIAYIFTPQTAPANSMTLVSPSGLLGYPSYYISVNMNCFTPTSYITTVKRNSWDGDLVGDFEMGLTSSKKLDTVCIRENEYPLGDILKSGHQPFHSTWTWKTADHDKPISLFWDDNSTAGAITCFSSKDKTVNNVLARFIPPNHRRMRGRTTETHRLEVSPQGHDYFDDILISALILERLRTTPTVMSKGPAFF